MKMETILKPADALHYLEWCRVNAFLFADGAPSARRSAIEMNREYTRATGFDVPTKWLVS